MVCTAQVVTDSSDTWETPLYRASLFAAEKSIRLNEIGDAAYWLEQAPEDLRGWEWNYLRRMIDESALVVPLTDEDVIALDISPDGHLLATADLSGAVRLRRLPDLEVVREIRGHATSVYNLCFSADGHRLATVSRDATSRVFDIESGDEVSQLKLDNPGVAAVAFSPDGQRVATCTWFMTKNPFGVFGVVWIWNPNNGEVISRNVVGVKPLDSIAWSADGQTIAVGSWDGLIHILDADGKPLREIRLPEDGAYTAVIAIALSPDGTRVAAGSKDRTAKIFSVEDGSLLATMTGHGGFVTEVAFGDAGKTLYSASTDGTLRSWHSESGKPIAVLRGHTKGVTAFDTTPDGTSIISASTDGTLRSWRTTQSFGGGLSFRTEVGGTFATTFSNDGSSVYLACYNGHVQRYSAVTGQLMQDWTAHPDSSCNTVAISADGTRLLTCSWDKTAKLWQADDHSLLKTFDAGAGVYHGSLSADGKHVALCVGKSLQLWDADSGAKLFEREATDTLTEADFSPNGALVATPSQDKSVYLWSTDNGDRIAAFDGHAAGVNCVAFSHDSTILASGDAKGRVVLWNVAKQKSIEQYSASDQAIFRLDFSQDDSRLAVASNGIALINPRCPGIWLRFYPQDDSIWHLSFDPAGRKLASCTTAGSIVILDGGVSETDSSQIPASSAQ